LVGPTTTVDAMRAGATKAATSATATFIVTTVVLDMGNSLLGYGLKPSTFARGRPG